MGIQLLVRNTRGAALTEAGETFREHASRACKEMELAREAILPMGELSGRFRVAVSLSFGPAQFARVLARMARLHPKLSIQSSYSDKFVDLITEGFDCAIRVGYMPDSNLIARRVGPLRGKLVASPSYIKLNGAPHHPSEMVNHCALMQATETWQFMDGDNIVTVSPQGRFKADNAMALAAAALEGIGIAWLPDEVIQRHVEKGDLVSIMTNYPPPAAGVYVVRPPGQHPSRKVKVLTEMLIDCFESIHKKIT